MAKNRFAQSLYGKIIYIFETDLKFNELSTIFDPSTYWVDVTGMDCEVGYLVSFKEGVGLVLAPPPNEEYTFEELKARKLELVNAWAAEKITGGFISSCSGEPVRYDSDKDTQLTMQGIALNVGSEQFAQQYPDGCPVRGYAAGQDAKSVFMLTPEQVMLWQADLSTHIGTCKQAGWAKQAEVNAATTKDELDSIDVEVLSDGV